MSAPIENFDTARPSQEHDLKIYTAEGKLNVGLFPTDKAGVYAVVGSTLTTRFVSIAEAFPDRPTPPLDLC